MRLWGFILYHNDSYAGKAMHKNPYACVVLLLSSYHITDLHGRILIGPKGGKERGK